MAACKPQKRALGTALAAILLAWTIALAGCGGSSKAEVNSAIGSADAPVVSTSDPASGSDAVGSEAETDADADDSASDSTDTASLEWRVNGTTTVVEVEEDAYYYDLKHVVTYLAIYDELPSNYITKSKARELGWEGGTPERFLEGSAIGGDKFGNYEQVLPTSAAYHECDLNTDGAKGRGSERLIWSDDDRYFHTEDHYESFVEYVVEDGVVTEGDEY